MPPDWAWLIERVGLPIVLLLVLLGLHWRLVTKTIADKDAEIERLRGERNHFRDRTEAVDDRIRREDR